MQLIGDSLIFSSRDLLAQLECEHRLHMDWSAAKSLIPNPKNELSREMQMLIDRGNKHENELKIKAESNGSYIEIKNFDYSITSFEASMKETLAAMSVGIETISQGTLFTGEYLAFVDFLILVKDENGIPLKDSKGRYIYDPVDAKSARSAKRSAVLQVASYAQALRRLGLPDPHFVHLWLAGDLTWSTPAQNVMDLGELFMERVNLNVVNYKGIPENSYAPPREACTRCKWKVNCEDGREKANDLSLVQEIKNITRQSLIEGGITTLGELANADDTKRPLPPHGVSLKMYEALRAQASIQIRGKGLDIPIFEGKDISTLSQVPESSPGDIWFDMEGDPFAENGDGLEYMFGVYWINQDQEHDFKTFDARDRDSERVAFINFMAWILEKLTEFPNAHIYHYAAYEKTALLKLARRHVAMEDEVDNLLRKGTLVDLYSVVRKAFRFSTTSMSIKHIEHVYQSKRDKDNAVNDAVGSVVEFEDALEQLREGNEEKFHLIVSGIRDYNRDDCSSTYKLDKWIREQMLLLNIEPAPVEPGIPEEAGVAIDQPVADALLQFVPTNREKRNDSDQAVALVAAALRYHVRESKPLWQGIFEKAGKEIDELESYDDVIVIESQSASDWHMPPKARKFRRDLVIQSPGPDFSMLFTKDDTVHLLYDPAPLGSITMAQNSRGLIAVAIDEVTSSEITIKQMEKDEQWSQLPIAILPGPGVGTKSIEKVLNDEIGVPVLSLLKEDRPPFENTCWSDLLLRVPPRQKSGFLNQSQDTVLAITSSLLDSDNSYVAVQGPPGTGKTHVGAHVIVNLVRAGWKIGVVAQSHSVIENLLNKVHEVDPSIPIGKESKAGAQDPPVYQVTNLLSWINSQSEGFVAGGTLWKYCHEDMRGTQFDLMVIDEAGQFSLANSLAALSNSRCALLLGDPQQLPQVNQATHPEPVEKSALSHLLGESPTIPPDKGYFLSESYRMHAEICKPVSHLQYEGRLGAHARCAKRELEGVTPGVIVRMVNHSGNTTNSLDEAKRVVELIAEILGTEWIDVDGSDSPIAARPIAEADVLVVTPYNHQVRMIKTELQKAGLKEVRVGTVDKFQGQEAPITVVSMATSSSEDLPRGIEFLLDPHRLNVAISRAQWVSYVVRSPQLSIMEPSTADGMVKLGKFVSLCKNREPV